MLYNFLYYITISYDYCTNIVGVVEHYNTNNSFTTTPYTG